MSYFVSMAALVVTLSAATVLANTEPSLILAEPFAGEPNTLCPPTDALVRDRLSWSAAGGWRSYDESFVKEIAQFIGAQWVGSAVGHVVCFYKGTDAFTFPVALVRNDVLIPTPTSDSWSKNKGGYVECISTDRAQCPFFIKPEPAAPLIDDYEEELLRLKKKSQLELR